MYRHQLRRRRTDEGAIATKLCAAVPSGKVGSKYPAFPLVSASALSLVGIYNELCVACQTNAPYKARVTLPKIRPITAQAHRSSSCLWSGSFCVVRFFMMRELRANRPVPTRFAAVHARTCERLGTKSCTQLVTAVEKLLRTTQQGGHQTVEGDSPSDCPA
jgi:hypothetical protein